MCGIVQFVVPSTCLACLCDPKVLTLEALAVQTSWDSSDEGAEGPAAKALRSLEQQVDSPLQ